MAKMLKAVKKVQASSKASLRSCLAHLFLTLIALLSAGTCAKITTEFLTEREAGLF